MIRVVSEQSEKEKAAVKHRQIIHSKMEEMAANLLRIIRGSGKPYRLEIEIVELADAIRAMWAEAGVQDTKCETVLYGLTGRERRKDFESPYMRDYEGKKDQILYAACQILASRLLGQHPQEIQGDKDLREGVKSVHNHLLDDSKAYNKEHEKDWSEKVKSVTVQEPGIQFIEYAGKWSNMWGPYLDMPVFCNAVAEKLGPDWRADDNCVFRGHRGLMRVDLSTWGFKEPAIEISIEGLWQKRRVKLSQSLEKIVKTIQSMVVEKEKQK